MAATTSIAADPGPLSGSAAVVGPTQETAPWQTARDRTMAAPTRAAATAAAGVFNSGAAVAVHITTMENAVWQEPDPWAYDNLLDDTWDSRADPEFERGHSGSSGGMLRTRFRKWRRVNQGPSGGEDRY